MASRDSPEAKAVLENENGSNEETDPGGAEALSRSSGPIRGSAFRQIGLRVVLNKMNRDLVELRSSPNEEVRPSDEVNLSEQQALDDTNQQEGSQLAHGFYHRGVAVRMVQDYLKDLIALMNGSPNDPGNTGEVGRITQPSEMLKSKVEQFTRALKDIQEANAINRNGQLTMEECNILKTMLEDYLRIIVDGAHEKGQQSDMGINIEIEVDKMKANFDMVDFRIPIDYSNLRYVDLTDSLSELLNGCREQVFRFSSPRSLGVKVFELEWDYLAETLSSAFNERLPYYYKTIELVQDLEVEDPPGTTKGSIFKSVGFCIEALTELARNFQAVEELLTICSKKDWWTTVLKLSNALPKHGIFRWSQFFLAIRACEWSMDIVDLAFYALQQVLQGLFTLRSVIFNWSEERCRYMLLVNGKPLYGAEGRSGNSPKSLLQVLRDLEANDVAVLIERLVELRNKPQWSIFSRDADTHAIAIANFLSQKLYGPVPEPTSSPYTFRIEVPNLQYIEFIDNGASGMVAKFRLWGQEVCVKTIKSKGLTRARFEQEAAILATVQHPNVVRMIGCAFVLAKECGQLIMELMEKDLRTVIEERTPEPAPGISPFPLIVAIDIMLQTAEGMQYLREHKILHRDLKAKNVLLNRCKRADTTLGMKFTNLAPLFQSEDYYIAKLADFGIAKSHKLAKSSIMTMMAGTTPWRAPEVFNDPDLDTAQNYQWPADVYSFAMTCYEILTGRIPFHGIPNSDIYKSIMANERPSLEGIHMSPVLKDLIEDCWATDPMKRPTWAKICRTLWGCKVEYWRSRIPCLTTEPSQLLPQHESSL